jgi:glycosyltransferase involved in cell wall biosynthesis
MPGLEAEGGGVKDYVVLDNGVDPDKFTALNAVWVGTFHKFHAVDWLCEQIPRVKKHEPRWRFILVGDGDMRPELEEHYGDVAHFVGMSDDVPMWLAAADLCLHAARKDLNFGSPTKIWEYMAAGKPVLAAGNLPSVNRVLRDADAGSTYEPENADDFLGHMIDYAGNFALRWVQGDNGYSWIRKHGTWERHVAAALGGLVEGVG